MNVSEKRRSEIINSALTYIGRSANLCKQYLSDDELSESLDQLNNCVEQYCKSDITFTAFNMALEKTEHSFKNLENISSNSVEEKFKELYGKLKITLNNNAISKHQFMVQYMRDIEDVELEKDVENSDDDIVASNSFTLPVDPITKSVIRNPVRNTQCGHVYENESILALIAKKTNVRCPYIGCPAVQCIQLANLELDRKLKKKIDKYFLNN